MASATAVPLTAPGGMLRVGACQTPEFLGDVEAAMACIEDFAGQADAQGIDLLLFFSF